jgi:two-component system response regulator YesN
MLTRLGFLKKISFKKRLLLYSLLFSVIPVFVLGTLSAYITSSSIQNEVNRNHQITLKQIEYQVDTFLKRLDYSSIQIAGDLIIEKSIKLGISMDDPETLETTLNMLETIKKYRSYPDIFYNVSLVYNKYDMVYSNQFGLSDIKDFPFYQELGSINPTHTGSVVIPPNTYPNQTDLLLLRNIPAYASSASGVLVLQVDAKKLYDFFRSVNLGNKSKVIVVDNEGRIVMSGDADEVGVRLLPNSDLFRFWRKPESFLESYRLDNSQYNLSSQKSSFNNWTYITLTPTKELIRKSENIRRITWVMVFSLIGIWILLSIIGSRRLYFPIHRMTLRLPKSLKTKDGLQALDSYMNQVVETNEHLKAQINQQLPYLKENVLLHLLRGEITEKEYMDDKMHCDLRLKGSWFYICVFEVDRLVAFKQSYLGRDRSLIIYALSKMIEEICEDSFPCATVSPQLGQVALIIGTEQNDEKIALHITQLCDLIRKKVSEYFHFTITVAVSRTQKYYGNINEGYQEALDLLGFRLLMGIDITITPQNAENPDSMKQSCRIVVKWQKLIVRSIAEGKIDQSEDQFIKMTEAIPQSVFNSKPVMGLFAHLIGEIDSLFEEMGYELSEFFHYNIYAKFYSASSIQEVKEWFCVSFFPSIKQHLESLNQSTKRQLIQQVVTYIRDYYETDLSLQQVADQFGLSTYQLSRMFKEETDSNFVDYLIKYRISKAQEWLAHSDMPIKEITERLCYTTTQNFSRVFKQTTGITPGKYRSELRHGDQAH